eukprot:1179811-Prorocentrum_minimum.AAC.2
MIDDMPCDTYKVIKCKALTTRARHGHVGLTDDSLLGPFLSSANIRAQELNSPVVERLNKGVMSVWSPTLRPTCQDGPPAVVVPQGQVVRRLGRLPLLGEGDGLLHNSPVAAGEFTTNDGEFTTHGGEFVTNGAHPISMPIGRFESLSILRALRSIRSISLVSSISASAREGRTAFRYQKQTQS